MATLTLEHVSRTYRGASPVEALKDVSLTISQGEYVAIEGPSGSGKSTLLNQLALLDVPTEGEYLIDSHPTTGLSDAGRARLRSATFAFIFQSFHLLEGRSVLDNVALGTLYRGLAASRRRELARQALEVVGLAAKAGERAARLSGGERQRVAIARAIASGAPVVVADEPTGNLDSANSLTVMETLEELNTRGSTLIVVTHDPALASRARRRLKVLDGIVTDTTEPVAPAAGSAAASPASVASPASAASPATPARSTGPSRRHAARRTRGAPGRRADADPGVHERDTLLLPSAQDGGPDRPAAPPWEVPVPEGRDSRVRVADALADAWRGLWTKTGRTLALMAAVALGVGLALTTVGLSQTASGQVSDIFDAQRNQRVAMTSPDLMQNPAPAAELLSTTAMDRVGSLAGVREVLVYSVYEQAPVATTPTDAANEAGNQRYEVVGLVGGRVPASILTLDSSGPSVTTLGPGEVIVGTQVATQIQLGPLAASPAIWVDGVPMRVVGILKDAGLQVTLINSVIMASDQVTGKARYAGAEIKVAPGAAPQVAAQAPVAWLPTAPQGVTVNAPPDPMSLRESIESNVTTMLLTLTGVTLLASVLSLTNSMTTAVFQRTGELGLRRAIGARRTHLTALILSESLTIGTLGGLLGAYASVMVILAVTIVRHWQPVLDPVLVPLGVVGGIVVGTLGGALATSRAGRIQPSDALRTT